jgi:CelD/BcsL family acetyltransferase involved in cellulose biosynthesis
MDELAPRAGLLFPAVQGSGLAGLPSKEFSAMSGTEEYTMEVHEGAEGFGALRDEWQGLWRRSREAAAEQTWEWQYLFWQHVVPSSNPAFFVARNARGKCAAVVGLYVCRDPKSWLSKATFIGRHYADYHCILVQDDIPETVGRMIVEGVVQRFRKRASFVELANVPQGCWTGRVLQQYLSSCGSERAATTPWETEAYAVPLPGTLEAYLERLGPSMRRNFHYERRRISKDFKAEFSVCSTPDDLESTLAAVEAVDRARRGAGSHYYRDSDRAFQRSVSRALCEMGLYRAFVLQLDGKPAAFVVGTLVRNSFRVPYTGYDPAVPGKYSLGKVMHFFAIEHCIQHGCTEYDLTRGAESYKKWLGGQPHVNLNLRLYRNRLDMLAEPRATRMVASLRRQTWLCNLYRRFRKT